MILFANIYLYQILVTHENKYYNTDNNDTCNRKQI